MTSLPDDGFHTTRVCIAIHTVKYTEASDHGAQIAFGGHLDGLDDLRVAGAAAEVAGDGLADRVLLAVAARIEVGLCGDEHARRADAALRRRRSRGTPAGAGSVRPSVGEALDRADVGALDLADRHEAAVDDRAVDEDRAGAALAFAAALLRAGQAEVLAQHVEEPAHAGQRRPRRARR